ncbi:heavy metal translocating P-type ATPase [Marinicella litoralis]|uniref:Cu2+-exporting ATPase n=1 Tax=Marinicella litoralis TaxID=644220 RepID=A0A4R6XVG7_9GAMM|nr:heavy metal translocating P-type ATPase [Marinicella litoralis]TDR23826.1 Cu2+-exporting ATPase [Marinicella litoralis]
MTSCFHCGEMVPKGCELTAQIAGQAQPMCCIGCQAVAVFLNDNDHAMFYQYRQHQFPAEQVESTGHSNQWQHLDAVEVFSQIVRPNPTGSSQVTIKVDGMYCSACGWLLQKVLLNRTGVLDLRINSVTQNMQIDFDPSQIKLSDIFNQIQQLGYQPLQQNSSESPNDGSRKDQLKKIAVAGFGMMFIMTLAVPLYSPDQFTVAPHIQRFFLMISLLVATGIYFYSGKSFIRNAIRDIRNRHLGMDVPVALSISLAYFVSLYFSFIQQGHVYFDSMAMFIFFLLLGRYVESQVRHQGMNVRESLFALVPISAQRLVNSKDLTAQTTETVPLNQIVKGDHILIKAGEVIPCDGQVLQGSGSVNEAILTGESALVDKQPGDVIYAGARLSSGQLISVTTVNNQDSFLAKLADLMELAQSKKPATLQSVDQLASYFVSVVLLLALGTAIWYGLQQPDALMIAVLSVLIATCPCALSLATPTALTAAGVHLLRQGVLVNNTGAITQLNKIKHWYFDKTGTLTTNTLSIKNTHKLSTHSEQSLAAITAGLQKISNHPIASAFKHHQPSEVTDAKQVTGYGVSGIIASQTEQQQWFMGSAAWLKSLSIELPEINNDAGLTQVYLVCEKDLVAIYELQVPIRTGVNALLKSLTKQGKNLTMISGDQPATVATWAEQLAIEHYFGGLKAEDKIQHIAKQQQLGNACVMVGDGVNDAPVLAQADVSISLKQGAYLAHAASDMIVLGKSLAPIEQALTVSAKTNAIIKQNLSWSLVYNLSVTPIAMMGLLAPWMAAIGMSLSSLLVVLNSRRLL